MSTLTPSQRRILFVMLIAVIVVVALLTGFIVTTIRSLQSTAFVETPTFVFPPTPSPTLAPVPPTLTPELNTTPLSDIEAQVRAARLFDQIARQAETLRELSPRTVVPLSFMDAREMEALIHRLYPGSSLPAWLLPYTALEILPQTEISVCMDHVAGLYVPEQQQLYVSTSLWESNADDQALLVHAYVHALQDQHFDLRGMMARATTTDATLAMQALAEGDATLLAGLYTSQDLATADWEHLAELFARVEQPGCGGALDSTAAWARLRGFPYRQGRQFAAALFQMGGWEVVNRAYVTPPRSTEQVLHPERYLGEPDLPDAVFVPDLSVVLGRGWTLRSQDTLGEFVVGLYLSEVLPETTAWSAADGWDGDTFVLWERDDAGRLWVWRSVWSSIGDASEFARALSALIPQHYLPTRPLEPPAGAGGEWWETDSGMMAVYRVGRYVILVQAPDTATLTRVTEALP